MPWCPSCIHDKMLEEGGYEQVHIDAIVRSVEKAAEDFQAGALTGHGLSG